MGGLSTVVPPDDNPYVVDDSGRRPRATLAEVDPERLYYVEPYDAAGVTYPQRWGFEGAPAAPGPGFFPPWHEDTIRLLRAEAPDVSVQAEVFSPFSQWIDLLGIEPALLAIADDPGRMLASLGRLAEGAATLACAHFDAGADAVVISSAYAGGGFISRRHYARFVLPFERALIAAVKRTGPDRPMYTHTCGAIGDRLDLMEATGTDGIDTLDPPPLGTVDLAEARQLLGGRLFIKGNVDPVNTILRGTPAACYEDARERIRIAGSRGGYILSTACSVPPHAPPSNIVQLARAAADAA
jgi:uroporphyrinogen decarboxylase